MPNIDWSMDSALCGMGMGKPSIIVVRIGTAVLLLELSDLGQLETVQPDLTLRWYPEGIVNSPPTHLTLSS